MALYWGVGPGVLRTALERFWGLLTRQESRQAMRRKMAAEIARGRARTIRGMERPDAAIMRQRGVCDWRDPR